MTAVNIVTTARAAHIVTDGIAYLPDGTLLSMGTKTFTAPHVPLVLAARGLSAAVFRLGPMIVAIHSTFDDLVERIEATLPHIFSEYLRQFPTEGATDDDLAGLQAIELVFAGWSQKRSRAESYIIRTHEMDLVPEGVNRDVALLPPAFQLTQVPPGVVACPFPLPSVIEERPPIDVDASYDDERLCRGLIDLMEAQRASLYPPVLPGRTERHIVGGFVQMTTVTREGINQRIIHRWPDDRIGERIVPAAGISQRIIHRWQA